jgi:diguanylate cyclase (GGDEF)-like protein
MAVRALKSYNATLGWAAGDDCLREVARAIVSAIRECGGLAVRYSVGVFAALLPGADRHIAAEVEGRVVRTLQGRAVAHPSSPAGAVVTRSVGFATIIPESGLPPSVLIERAERELAQAKSGERSSDACFPQKNRDTRRELRCSILRVSQDVLRNEQPG